MQFRQNHIYPLRRPDRYDDGFGNGYEHALLVDRGPIAADCWVHDAWIVKANGDVHPGLKLSPVPVRIEDVDVARGRPFEAPTKLQTPDSSHGRA